ncbi:MAG TPA: hypothetical protein DEO85_03250 [Maritimibacter sp.]|nr:hypothetical protein [Maritimibacter sp.]
MYRSAYIPLMRQNITSDLATVELLLKTDFPSVDFEMVVDRHFSALEKQLACVTVHVTPRDMKRDLKERAEAGFRALGYTFDHNQHLATFEVVGSTRIECDSAHKRIELLDYVYEALYRNPV